MTISCEIYLSFLVSLSSKGTNFLSSLHFLYTLFRSKAVTIASSLKKNFWTFPLWMAGTLPSSFPSCKYQKLFYIMKCAGHRAFLVSHDIHPMTICDLRKRLIIYNSLEIRWLQCSAKTFHKHLKPLKSKHVLILREKVDIALKLVSWRPFISSLQSLPSATRSTYMID